MSGFVAVWHRDGELVDPARFSNMLDALGHRGPDGKRVLLRPAVALGHQHFWTTPEELGEAQPLTDEEAGLDLVFDGRLDNRPELLASLGCAGEPLSDSALVLRAFASWGSGCFEKFLGPFALAILDRRNRRLLLARDCMGSRTLYYKISQDLALVASEECALLEHPEVGVDLDEGTLAEFFAVSVPRDGSTFFRGIRELLPAHLLEISPDGVRLTRYWRPDLERRIRCRGDAEYAEHFRSLLAEAVRCRLRMVGTRGVMMSGGMDSPSVAGLAALELSPRGEGPLQSFSWVFDELRACDERPWIEPMVARFGLAPTWIKGDGRWPLRDFDTWPLWMNQPWSNCYEPLKQDIYRSAAARGCRVLLCGVNADLFYSGSEEWLTDLLRDGRPFEALRHAAKILRKGNGEFTREPGIRRLARRVLLASGPPVGNEAATRPWLTEYARRLINGRPAADDQVTGALRPEQYDSIFGPLAYLRGNLAKMTNSCGIELRDPFWDRRLAEFMLAIPGHQLFRPGRTKYIQRNAMAGVLPDEVTNRSRVTPLVPLYLRGLIERGLSKAREVLNRADAIWRPFVREDWLFNLFPDRMPQQPDGAALLVPWQCISAEMWKGAVSTRYDLKGTKRN